MIPKDKEGIILVNKPQGVTSHDVVDMVRRKLSMKRVGHAGTLDPLAEGLLVILVGKATKLFSKFVNFDKEYLGVLKLGEVTTTGDSQGELVEKKEYADVDDAKLQKSFASLIGDIKQVPPMVSALRKGGKRLYALARRGITVEREPRDIKIYELKILKIELPLVEFYVRCSKGTYVRALAEDIGKLLGCGAHIIKIRRLSIGFFKLDDAVNVEDIEEKHIRKFDL